MSATFNYEKQILPPTVEDVGSSREICYNECLEVSAFFAAYWWSRIGVLCHWLRTNLSLSQNTPLTVLLLLP